MMVGDKIRLRPTPACRDVLGLNEGCVGTVKEIDGTSEQPGLFISFSGECIYTSALREQDYDVLPLAERVAE